MKVIENDRKRQNAIDIFYGRSIMATVNDCSGR